MRCRLLWITASCAWLCAMSLSHAERVPLSPKELQRESTHIFQGEVLGVYSRVVDSTLYGEGTRVTKYVIEIRVDSVTDGHDMKPGDIAYVRAWKLKQRGAAGLSPGPSGHFAIPKEGQRIRVHAARGRYRPTGQEDRGMTAVYPNGFEVLPE
jgi:hypothetical protein